MRYDVQRGCLIYDSDDPELLQEMVEEYHADYAYGRELRRLTDAELLEHLPRRLSGYAFAEARDEHSEPLDELPGEETWQHAEDSED